MSTFNDDPDNTLYIEEIEDKLARVQENYRTDVRFWRDRATTRGIVINQARKLATEGVVTYGEGSKPGAHFAKIERILSGEESASQEPCKAFLWHGPGHQSKTPCRLTGDHDVHEAVYGSEQQFAQWRDGEYTSGLRAEGIKFDPESYPENMAMTGFFDEPPELEGSA